MVIVVMNFIRLKTAYLILSCFMCNAAGISSSNRNRRSYNIYTGCLENIAPSLHLHRFSLVFNKDGKGYVPMCPTKILYKLYNSICTQSPSFISSIIILAFQSVSKTSFDYINIIFFVHPVCMFTIHQIYLVCTNV